MLNTGKVLRESKIFLLVGCSGWGVGGLLTISALALFLSLYMYLNIFLLPESDSSGRSILVSRSLIQ